MNRIDQKFKDLSRQGKKALIAFITAGDPSLDKNAALVPELEKIGVDLVELGVPFSDPLADGPVIQASSLRALNRGVNLKKIIALAARIRKNSQIPLVLMSYLNPITNYGLQKFAKDASLAGVDGVILPELPVEEGAEIAAVLNRHHIHVIYLMAPTSSPERRKRIAKASRGFIYYVSITGVTGVKHAIVDTVNQDLKAIKKISKLPVCAGFGVSTPEQAHAMSRQSDGVIVGSAIVKLLSENTSMNPSQFCKKYIAPFVRAVKG